LVELAIIVALVVAVMLAAAISGARADRPPTPTAAVKVGVGESLWSVAATHPVRGMTTQQTVDLIKRANGLSDSAVTAGTVLQIPSAEQRDVALMQP
jgi:Tfp pilus assembly protein FimV